MSKPLYGFQVIITPMKCKFDINDKFEHDGIFTCLSTPEVFKVTDLREGADFFKEIYEVFNPENTRIDYYFKPLRAEQTVCEKIKLEFDKELDCMFDIYLKSHIFIIKELNENTVINNSLLYMIQKDPEKKEGEETPEIKELTIDHFRRCAMVLNNYEELGDKICKTYIDIVEKTSRKLDWNIKISQ